MASFVYKRPFLIHAVCSNAAWKPSLTFSKMTFKYRWPEWHFRDNWSHISAFFPFFPLFFFHHFRKQKVSMCIFETLNPFWAKKVGKLVAKPPPFTFTSIAMEMVQREDARVCLFLVSLTHTGAAVHEPGANQMQLVCHRNRWVRATLAFFYSCHCLAGKKNWEKKYRKGKKLLALTCNWQVNIWQTSSRE